MTLDGRQTLWFQKMQCVFSTGTCTSWLQVMWTPEEVGCAAWCWILRVSCHDAPCHAADLEAPVLPPVARASQQHLAHALQTPSVSGRCTVAPF